MHLFHELFVRKPRPLWPGRATRRGKKHARSDDDSKLEAPHYSSVLMAYGLDVTP